MKIVNGRCTCTVADPCPLGKVGSETRCTEKELRQMIEADPKEVDKINSMSQIAMARLWRFAPSGHKYFDSTLPYSKIFKARFDQLGGITPEISKAIGW